jgi:hypothetical protein
MNPLNTGLVLLACAALLTILGKLAQIKRRQVRRFDLMQKEFYRHASVLLASPRISEDMVRFLNFGAGAIGKRWAAWLFIIFTPWVRSRPRSAKGKMLEEAQALPFALEHSFYTAVDSFFAAMGSQSLFLGFLFRWVTRPVRKPKEDNPDKKAAVELALVERVCEHAAA